MKIRVSMFPRRKGAYPRTFTVERKNFVDFIKRGGLSKVEKLIADVCLTRWYFDGADWYSAPRYKYIPGRTLVELTPNERLNKYKLSPHGFTQC